MASPALCGLIENVSVIEGLPIATPNTNIEEIPLQRVIIIVIQIMGPHFCMGSMSQFH